MTSNNKPGGAAGMTRYMRGAILPLLVLQFAYLVWSGAALTLVFDMKEDRTGVFDRQMILSSLSMLDMAGFVVHSLFFLVLFSWIYRTFRLAMEAGFSNLKHTAGWSVGWWLIPVANFIKPYYVLMEMWQFAGWKGDRTGFIFDKKADSSPILGAFWIFWVTGMVLSFQYPYQEPEAGLDFTYLAKITFFNGGIAIFDFTSGVLLYLFVGKVRDRLVANFGG